MENFSRVIYFNRVTGERTATQKNIIPFVLILTALAVPDVLLHTSCFFSLVSNLLIPDSNYRNHPKYIVPILRHLYPDQPRALISTYDAEDVFKSLNSHDQ